MEDLSWLLRINDKLRTLLNPELAKDIEAAAEARAEGISLRSRESLYPLDPLAHMEAIGRLMRKREFLALAVDPLSKISLDEWLTSVSWADLKDLPLTGHLTIWYSEESIEYVMKERATGDQGSIALPQMGMPFGQLPEKMLELPIALHLLERYPFEGQAWDQEDHEQLLQDLRAARPHLERFVWLLAAHAPKILR